MSSEIRTGAARVALAATCAVLAAPGSTLAQGGTAPREKTPTVLFMCPHGAAKSVLASVHFRRLAKERGLNVRVDSAGTDPDPAIAPAVARHLKQGGYDVPAAKPRQASTQEMADADVIVSIGCDRGKLAAPRGALIEWSDVPSPGENMAAADARIQELAAALVEEMLRRQKLEVPGK